MHRWFSVSDLPADLGPTATTIGIFDGVHRGHRAVLGQLAAQASERGLTSVAITFDPHPLAVLHPERAPALVCSLDQRLELLENVGIGGVLVMEFTREFAQLTPREFVQQIMLDALHTECAVLGKDSRFGRNNTGDVNTLRELGEELGFDTVVVEDVGSPGEGQPRWSSSMTRGHLAEGDVAAAAKVLGRPHKVAGEVVYGNQRGRELGFPTANLATPAEGLVPADGVYAGWLHRPSVPSTDPDSTLPAAISIGTNPTFDGTERRVEANVLDRTDLELYGEQVTVEFVEYLRPTLKFDSVDALIEQMNEDVARCRAVLSTVVPPQ